MPIYHDTLKCIALKLNSYFHLDPHVKVEGKRGNVLEAKKKILEVLETRVRALCHYFPTASLQKKLFGKSFCYEV